MFRRLPVSLLVVLFSAGCAYYRVAPPTTRRPPPPPPKDYSRALPPGAHALRKIPLGAWPDLSGALAQSRRGELLASVERSLNYLSKPSSRGFFPRSGISHEHTQASLEAFRDLLASARSEDEILRGLRRRFDFYQSIGCDDEGTVLFTGYYTPEFSASLTPSPGYTAPLHRAPENHVKDPLTGATLGLRQPDGSIDPSYPGRDELLSGGMLDGLELAWLESPFEAYVVGVQGSAFLRLPTGERFQVGYAGTNGKPYSSIGQALIEQGKLKPEELNLRNLIRYFRDNPEEFAPLAAHNERYVYFQEGDGGPFGCLNERVTPLCSIATDKSIFPRGSLCFVEAKLPVVDATSEPYRGFALDHDAGGAIRAPGRVDVYMGIGDAAGERAGHTWSEGQLFYVLLKDAAQFASR